MSNLCEICPRLCKTERKTGSGFCRAGEKIKINLYQKHYGEEPCLTGSKGSGTVFFSYCNLACVYCQNYKISQQGAGKEIEQGELAKIMLSLQDSNVHNINLVTPTHYSYQIRQEILIAKKFGLRLPVVWNSNAYEKTETLKEMEGLVDIYLPDFRYYSERAAKKYSQAGDYPQVAKRAVLEMFRQVGHLKFDETLIATRGMLIRILVLPHDVGGAIDSLEWIADNLGPETYISLMAQYYPAYKAGEDEELALPLDFASYETVLKKMDELGFYRGFSQEPQSTPYWTPSFYEE